MTVSAHLGRLHVASVLDDDGDARLVLKGANGTVSVVVPEQFIEPLETTVAECTAVYAGDTDGTLVGDGGER